MNRISQKQATMLETALLQAKLATCPRANAGAVICTLNYTIISTGYNGSPMGMPHCKDEGCLIIDNHCSRVLHAEENAILSSHTSLNGTRMFCTHLPCISCANRIIQVGIVSVIFNEVKVGSYTKENRKTVWQLFNKAGVEFKQGAIIRRIKTPSYIALKELSLE